MAARADQLDRLVFVEAQPGQIIVENVPSVSNLVTSNAISGNPTITYNGIVGTNTFYVAAWREVR